MPVLTKAPLRVLCDGMKGENYWTHGCMAYMAACLGLPEAYHYQFFNCYSGDSVTLLFSKDPAREVRCLSHELTEEGLERDFRALGYSYTYVSGITEETRAGYLERIRESLDRGLPVMARGGDSDAMRIEFNCIVGWEEDALLYLFCDKDKAEKVAGAAFTELVFAGEKIAEPLSAADGYRDFTTGRNSWKTARFPSGKALPEMCGRYMAPICVCWGQTDMGTAYMIRRWRIMPTWIGCRIYSRCMRSCRISLKSSPIGTAAYAAASI